MKQLTAGGVLVLIYAMTLWGVLIAGGCSHIKPQAAAAASGESIARATVRGESADRHVEAVVDRVTGEERLHLSTAHIDLSNQAKDLLEAKQANDVARAYAGQLESQLAAREQQIDGMRGWVFGPWTHRWSKVVLVAGLAAFTLYELASHYFAGGSLVAKTVGAAGGLLGKLLGMLEPSPNRIK
jgi:hypothetical protein